ncbi:uncharacterized protein TNCV_2369091 [Trichonephila clavipes]|nr:uncharacterized protein TNCV_2369091 [Trichonephila clavipes]
MSGSSISGSAVHLDDLPEFSDQAAMAYERHQKSLVPCSHCERQFRPDRLPIHQRACINRPKTREYIVPEGEKTKEKKEEVKKKEEEKVKEEKERKGEEEKENEEEEKEAKNFNHDQ